MTPPTPAEDLASTLEGVGCRRACPVHTDAGRYAQALARHDAREAVRIARRNNPLVSVCAHICTHPCETACLRSGYDAPLALRRLKRLALEAVDPGEVAPRPYDRRGEGHRVAVVGAGPAGLSAAHDLALLGYSVTVFEAGPAPGGLPAQAIPEFRLPRAALQRDIAGIVALGVEIRTRVEIPLDADLRDDGFERTVLTPGLPSGTRLPVSGSEHPRVVDGLDVLRGLADGRAQELGPRVVIIGGGDTAVDVARAVVRLPSVDTVELIFRRPRLYGRSRRVEAEAAEAEGVRLRPLSIPTSIEPLEDGLGVVYAEVATYHDVQARYRPRARPGTRCRTDADHVVVAVGRQGPPLPAGGTTVLTHDGSQIVVAATWSAGGDRTGAGTVIRAVADGQALARRVDRALSGGGPPPSRPRSQESGPPPHAWPRVSPRKQGAAEEGSRCLNCYTSVRSHDEAVCVACGRCVDGCPAGALALGGDIGETVLARDDRCLRCGLCVERCPVGCLQWQEHADDG